MSRQLEQIREDRQSRKDKALLLAVEGGLNDAIERSGGMLGGFSVKLNGGDCLLILKADFPAGSQISFVGANDFSEAIIKAVRLGNQDKLVWKADKYPVK
jgi:hypothetical protein